MPKEIYIDENGNEIELGSAPSALSGLLDTDISSATQGEVLAVDSNGKWANTTLQASDFIKTDTTGSITTDGTGFYSITRTGNYVVLSAWSPQTDIIILPFTATGSTASGYYKWWFKVCGADLTPKTNFNLTIYYSYVVL